MAGPGIASERPPESLQQPPHPPPTEMPQLSPLAIDARGQPIPNRRAWLRQRAAMQKQWQAFMGEFPKRKAPLRAQFLEKEEFSEFTRQYVRYQVEAGVYTDGYLLIPKNRRGKLPAVVVFHGTTALQAKGVAGVESEYAEGRKFGVHLVQRGYVVLCPRNFIFDDSEYSGAEQYTANVRAVQERHPTWTGMARMTWDAVRAADFLESLPQVDKNRIGRLGLFFCLPANPPIATPVGLLSSRSCPFINSWPRRKMSVGSIIVAATDMLRKPAKSRSSFWTAI